MTPWARQALAAAAGAVLIVVACDRSESPPEATATPSPKPTPTVEPPDPQATLKRSAQVMGALRSFRFQLRHEGGTTQLIPGIHVVEARGEVVKPDRISMAFTGSYRKIFAIKSDVVTLGDQSYMRNPLTTEWEVVATGVSPLGFFNPALGISSMMSRLEGVRWLDPNASVGGKYRLGGTVDAEALAPLLGLTLEGVTVEVELTVDAREFYLLEARVIGRVTPSDADDIVRVVTISDFNEPISIEAPI